MFAALAEYERELITEQTRAGLQAARARGRKGGRPRKMDITTLQMAMNAMGVQMLVQGRWLRNWALQPQPSTPMSMLTVH